jgi:ABC-type uncharacterized transport system substrate-binding protein
MTRRTIGPLLAVTLALGLLMVPLAADGQPAGKGYRIGYLGNSAPSLEIEIVQAFRQGLRELGYVEGENLAMVYRWAEGSFERLPDLVAELVSLPVDVIVTVGMPGTRAAKHATSTWLGKEMILLSSPPRRTVRTDHPVHGSSHRRTPRGALML